MTSGNLLFNFRTELWILPTFIRYRFVKPLKSNITCMIWRKNYIKRQIDLSSFLWSKDYDKHTMEHWKKNLFCICYFLQRNVKERTRFILKTLPKTLKGPMHHVTLFSNIEKFGQCFHPWSLLFNQIPKSHVVYEIKCTGCNASYVEQTTRHLRHNYPSISQEKDHLKQCEKDIDNECVKILDSTTNSDSYHLTLEVEALWIRDINKLIIALAAEFIKNETGCCRAWLMKLC